MRIRQKILSCEEIALMYMKTWNTFHAELEPSRQIIWLGKHSEELYRKKQSRG